jgi:HAMP domain-containing protein
MFKGKEIKKLVLVSTLCCVLLIVSVSLFLILTSRNNLHRQTEKMKTAMAEQIADHLQSCYQSMAEFIKSTPGIQFGSGAQTQFNSKEIIDFFITSLQKAYDADFAIIYTGNQVTAAVARPGLEVPDIKPGIAGDEEYVILNELGGRQGTFLVMDKTGLMPGGSVIFGIDNTEQIAAIKQAYEEEKSSAIKQQVIGVIILFLLLLALSLAIIYISITRWLGRPISRLGEEAREIMRGESPPAEEVREGSIFANLQRLLSSGRVILGKGGVEAAASATAEKPFERREVNKVIAVWAAITTLLFLASTIIMLVTSIAMTNTKTNEILTNVDREMADYYSSAYDSINSYTKTNPDVYVGNELWNPNAPIDREATIERLANLVRVTFNCDAAVAYVEPASGGKYFTAVREGVELKKPLPTSVGDPVTIYHGYYRPGDLVMVLMNSTDYPGFGADQFAYYVIDITKQAGVLDDLYQSGSGSLLKSQLLLSLLFLLLCLALSPLAMAWATRKYITRPILELDAISARLMEGDLDIEIAVDEKSSFADIQRLLIRAQELLKSM